ncbi:MAG: hypothetical protein WCB85_14205, partial [Candidatus Dormiibacterota bacterium]
DCSAAGGVCAGVPSAACPGSDADQIAICRMDAAGLTTTPLFTVSSVDIWLLEQSNGAPVSTCSSSGSGAGSSPCFNYTCDTKGDGPGTGSGPCENEYSAQAVLQNQNPPGYTYPQPWPPHVRNVTATSADFAELTVTFTYHLFAYPGSFTLTTTNVVRMEPQVG